MTQRTHLLDATAQRFLETVPDLLHGLRNTIQTVGKAPVTMAQFRTMAVLHHGPRSLNELADMYDVTPPTMSRLISTLVERGWVERERDEVDRRQVNLSLTPQGEKVWMGLGQHMRQHLAEILDNLTPEELASLEVGIRGIRRILDQLKERETTEPPFQNEKKPLIHADERNPV